MCGGVVVVACGAEELRNAADELTGALLHSNGLGHHVPVPGRGGAHSHGHRVLPVYIFSLLGLDKALLLDHLFMHTAYRAHPPLPPCLPFSQILL